MSLRTLYRAILAVVLASSLGGFVAPPPVAAEDVGYWPEDEDDNQLKNLDNEVLRLQEARFRAIFSKDKDEKEIERIQKEFKKAQDSRRELLRKTGRY